MIETFGRFVHFLAGSFRAALMSFGSPRETLRQTYVILVGSLPLIMVAGLALGVVVWLHLNGVVDQLVKSKVPEYLAMAVVLEFAPLGAGMVVGGRSGASLGAELSSMRLTEQVDALESMGMGTMRTLVGPRVCACAIALPVLTLYLGFCALASSYLAEMAGGGMYSGEYLAALARGLGKANLIASTLKTVLFGVLIGTAGCYCGLNAPPGAEGVGTAATRGVVLSVLLVLVSNVVLVKLIQGH